MVVSSPGGGGWVVVLTSPGGGGWFVSTTRSSTPPVVVGAVGPGCVTVGEGAGVGVPRLSGSMSPGLFTVTVGAKSPAPKLSSSSSLILGSTVALLRLAISYSFGTINS